MPLFPLPLPSALSITAIAIGALALPAAQAALLDQSFDATNGASSYAVVGPSPGQTLAQTFTAGMTGTLTSVSLMLDRQPSAAGPLTLSILGTNAGVPLGTGATLFSQSFDISGLPTTDFAYQFTDFDISAAGVQVVSGQVYAIALTRNSGSFLSQWVSWNARTGASASYAGGALYAGDGDLVTSYSAAPDGDAGFKTFVEPAAAVPEPGPLALLSVGLIGLASTRRRRA
ncbi:MAG: PEP-CTERM sorting domain-containing protein [Rubrivivax sp.]